MSAAACQCPTARLRTLDVTWRDGTRSIPGVWSETLCEACIPTYLAWLAQRGIKATVNP